MRTSHRNIITYGVAGIIVILITISAYNHTEVRDISARLNQIVSEHNILIQHFSRARQLHHERSFLLQALSNSRDPFEQDELLIKMNYLFSEIIAIREQVLQLPLTPDELRLIRRHYLIASQVVDAQQQVAQLVINDNHEDARNTIKNKVVPLQKVAFSRIEQIITLENSHNTRKLNETNQQIRMTNAATGLLLVFGIVFTLTSAFVINRIMRHEIIQRQETENQLRNSELRERLIRENIIDSVITIDHNGIIQSCNRATTTIFGYDADELTGHNINILMPEPHRSKHDSYLANYLDSGKGRVIGAGREFVALCKDGTKLPIDIEVSEATINSKRLFIAVIRDITEKKEAAVKIEQAYKELEQRVKARTMALEQTNKSLSREIRERKKAQQQLTYLATHDPLTSLPNRTVFNEHLVNAIRSARRNKEYAALLFMDLDRFKAVNDSFGHDAGDQLLKAVCQRIKDQIRDMDTVARLGGDEFGVVLCGQSGTGGAEIVADKLVHALHEPFLIDGHCCEVGVSIGISYYPADGEDIDTLLSKADDAMYEAKRSGKNSYRVYLSHSATG